MIAFQKETHSETPQTHEWHEVSEGHYRSICARWTESKENLMPATEVTCEWCLNRQRRRLESQL